MQERKEEHRDVVALVCIYPRCNCACSFPEEYKPSVETECPSPKLAYDNYGRGINDPAYGDGPIT